MCRNSWLAWLLALSMVGGLAAAPAGGAQEESSEASSVDLHGEAAEAASEAAHGDGHHDPYDLSHGNASPLIEDPSELKSDLAIWTFVVFLLLLALLAKFAWGPIVAGLDRREQAIADQIEEARRSAEQAALRLQEYEARLAAAAEEARGIVAEARRDAETARERIVAEAQAAAQRERERAVEDITAAKNVALQEMTQHSVDLAELMAQRLLRRELTAQDRVQLVKEALDQLPSRN